MELMLANRGDRAHATAADIGFTLIADMPNLSEEDWQTIASNADQQTDPEPLGYRSGIAVVEGKHVMSIRLCWTGSTSQHLSYTPQTAQKLTVPARVRRLEGAAGIVPFAVSGPRAPSSFIC